MTTESRHTIVHAGDTIAFNLRRSERKSLEIAVHPDGAVCVKAPLKADENLVMERVRKRARWINRQLDYFAQFAPRTPPPQFVGGESHLYLGRKYRLKITPSATESVLLKHGLFLVTATDVAPGRVAKLLEEWYRDRAAAYFSQVFEECWRQHHFHDDGVRKPALKIRSMKTRWGSLSGKGALTLNLELIKAPGECVEYVVVHELCHLLHPNHGKGFYKLLESRMPDWTKRKRRLEMACL